MSPVRVQRKRTKGWKAPLCSCGTGRAHGPLYVGRGTKWGNPWKAVEIRPGCWAAESLSGDRNGRFATRHEALAWCVIGYRTYGPGVPIDLLRPELGGHDLMCWCALGEPCHADVLLDYANSEAYS